MIKDIYHTRINQVMDHIEKNLGQELPLQELARVACFSPYHFHRIFRALTGETLSQFIQRLRLEKAATQLRYNPKKSVTEIALDSGFASSATFARAFKELFKSSASAYRTRPTQRDSKPGKANRRQGKTVGKPRQDFRVTFRYVNGQEPALRWRVSTKGGPIMKAEVEVRQLPDLPVIYVRHTGPYKGDAKLFEKMFTQLTNWAAPRGLFKPPETKALAVYHDDPEVTDESKLRLSVCFTAPADIQVDGGIGKMTLPGGQYAVARFTLNPQEYESAWNAVYGGWLPQSGYQPDDRLAFEMYPMSPDEHPEGKHTVDICVPVKPV